MKFKILIFLSVALTFLPACENELEQDLVFSVNVAPGVNVQISDSIITAPKGTSLKFEFAGEPDFISFAFNRFNQTKSTLTFNSQAAWGTHIRQTLSVFLFETPDTLLMNNPKQDSLTIVNRKWIDITSQCNLPEVANVTTKTGISLNDYRGKKVCLAFLYKTDFGADWQPTWTISNLQINDTILNTNTRTASSLAATMGFKPFDMRNAANPYLSADAAGVWYLANPASMVIKRSPSGSPLNTDWLISKPVEIAKGVSFESAVIAVKNTTNRVESYSYKFDNPGEYTVTFFASNANYLRRISTERKLKVLITE